ncbi:MAG: hypothetical protein IJM85_00300 [Clostridia bacterium]|nr:hypothetical protein [Clostridia bacterium]
MANDPRKKHDDDDGRVIADMSEVTRPNLWSFRFPSSAPWHRKEREAAADIQQTEAKYDPNKQLTPEERRSYILAAVGAGLGIAAVFGVVFAIFIILIGHVHF